MYLLKQSRSTNRLFFFTCLFVTVFLLAFAAPVQAADPCNTAGVLCVTSSITSNTTWTSDTIYYVKADITVSNSATLTIQGGTIIKFDYPYSPTSPNLPPFGLFINKGANLVFQDTNPTDKRVLFTSGRDDFVEAGGDINGDDVQTLPSFGDWEGLVLTDWTSTVPIENLTFRYSKDGLNIKSSTVPVPPEVVIQNNAFYQSTCGVTIAAPVNLNNAATVIGNGFYGNQYGLCTLVTGTGTGQAISHIKCQSLREQRNPADPAERSLISHLSKQHVFRNSRPIRPQQPDRSSWHRGGGQMEQFGDVGGG